MISTAALRFSLPGVIVIGLAAGQAAAQPSPMPAGSPAGEDEPKPEGVAEAAPKAAGLLATTPSLPPPRDRHKKFENFIIDGYLRTRGDWFKNLHLGFDATPDTPTGANTSNGGAPYPQAVGCSAPAPHTNCPDSLKSSNLRLRVEPSIHLTETISVHSQIDLLDNVLMSTLDPGYAGETLVVRRAWAEVATGLGILKFGRMPDHWGLGIVSNSGRRANTDYATWETLFQPGHLANIGGTNPVGYDLDSDYGDSVNRLSFTAMIPGTPFRAVAALDWRDSVLATEHDADPNTGQPIDADDGDDMKGWMLAVSRFDAPADFTDRVARGKLGVNYGLRLNRITQDYAYDQALIDANGGNVAAGYIRRGTKIYQPDLWFKLGWRKLLLEAEMALDIGSIENFSDLGIDGEIDVLAWGAVVRASSRALEDKLGFGLELGAASGDETDAPQQGETRVSRIPLVTAQDKTLNRFAFDPDYKIDLILFRELLGQVSNAFYARPWLSYELTRSITFRAQNVTSAALRPVSTPGNSAMWGMEFDADLGYSGNGFHAGIAYGLFLPLGAMNHPAPEDVVNVGGPGFNYGTNIGDAGNAHTIQARFAVEF